MAYLAAAAVLVGLLAATNLLLTIGVVRRLREHTAALTTLRSRGSAAGDGGGVALPAGSAVGEFVATSVDGRSVTRQTLGERPLIGFISPHCAPCAERLPAFVDHAKARPGGPDGVLAVVVGGAHDTAEIVTQLRPVATVIVEPDQGPVQQVLAVTGFPSFLLIEDGVVLTSSYDIASVAEIDLASLPVSG